jgi:hypothetical protein
VTRTTNTQHISSKSIGFGLEEFYLFSLEESDSHDIFLSSNSTDKMKLAVLASVIVGAAAFAPNSVSKQKNMKRN